MVVPLFHNSNNPVGRVLILTCCILMWCVFHVCVHSYVFMSEHKCDLAFSSSIYTVACRTSGGGGGGGGGGGECVHRTN